MRTLKLFPKACAATVIAAAFMMLSTTQVIADGKGGAAKAGEAIERALAAKPETLQFTNVLDTTVSPAVGAAGGAFLVRSKNGVTARVMVTDLQPGHAHTFWFVFFNKPENCAQIPCADTDLMNAGGAIHYGSGGISSHNGTVNVTYSATSGGPPEGAVGNPSLPEPGLVKNNGFKAEVHLVVVDHGVPAKADFTSADPNVPGTWAWELTHPLPPGPAWIRAAIFIP